MELRRDLRQPGDPEPRLIRAIGRWALTAAVINCVIGSGIFGLPAPLAHLTGAWSPVAVLLAGGSVFIIVLCFAEVGSRFDEAGGPYLYSREAFGPAIGFQIGWLHIWTRILSAAAVLNILVAYLAVLVPWTGLPAGRAFAITFAVTSSFSSPLSASFRMRRPAPRRSVPHSASLSDH